LADGAFFLRKGCIGVSTLRNIWRLPKLRNSIGFGNAVLLVVGLPVSPLAVLTAVYD
jgi:hypothetical protein